jgi:hypothetical protein
MLAQQLPTINPNDRADQRPSEDGDKDKSHGCQPGIVRAASLDDIRTN